MTKFIHYGLFAGIALSAGIAFAEPNFMTETTSQITASTCDMTLSMQDEAEIANWRTVLDGVMGGRSSGNRFAENDYMVFKGVINTNGGGFSSIRRPMVRTDMADAKAVRLRIRQDGRQYRLTFRTDARFRGRSVSYQLDIPQTPKGEWADIALPLTDFATSVFGNQVNTKPFNASDVREMGIILADGIDGPFQIDIAEISCA